MSIDSIANPCPFYRIISLRYPISVALTILINMSAQLTTHVLVSLDRFGRPGIGGAFFDYAKYRGRGHGDDGAIDVVRDGR